MIFFPPGKYFGLICVLDYNTIQRKYALDECLNTKKVNNRYCRVLPVRRIAHVCDSIWKFASNYKFDVK